ncbi:PAS domain-containing protein [Paraflavisolibacter sp. H34]|uniref:PAS domain-containing protein n=1 Tax=Huijunlia imazamoxiresistens TaxID=3127457 RepID=UPI00301B39EC
MEQTKLANTPVSRDDFLLFEARPGLALALLPDAPRFTCIAASHDLLRAFNQKKEAVVGRGLLDIFPQTPAADLRAALTTTLHNGEPADLPPLRFDTSNGADTVAERYWKLRAVPVPGERGETRYLVCTAEGIPAPQKAETAEAPDGELLRAYQRLREMEREYHNLIQSMEQGYCALELLFEGDRCIDYRHLETNPAFERQSGLEGAMGKSLRELVPAIEPKWLELYGRVAQTGRPVRVVERSPALNRWFEVYAQPLGSPGERKVAVFFTDITEQKTAEQSLQRSEERLRKVISIETVGVIYFNLEGTLLDANAAFERMSGFSREALKSGKVRWDELTPPEFMEATLKSREEFLSKGQNTPYEKQYLRPDGSRWWGLFAGKRLNETECVEFVLDITGVKEKEALLVQKDQNFRNIIHHAPVAMAIFRGEQLVLETVNRQMLELVGTGPEIIGLPVLEVLPQLEDQPIYQALQQVYRTGAPQYGQEWLVPLPRGGVWEDRYFNFAYTPVVEDARVTGVMEVATEVTEQVLARKKIEQSHRELLFVLDIMPILTWQALPDGTVDFINRVYLDYSGLPAEQLKGYGWMQILHPEDAAHTREVWQEALARGAHYKVEHRLRDRQGAYHWFLTRGIPLKDETGGVLKWFGTSTDIDEQKRAKALLEQRVQERTAELEIRNRELEEFSFVSSHDLQEPLRKIALFTGMVRSESADLLSEASRHRLDRVLQAAQRMSKSLKDILDYSRLSKEVQLQPVDLQALLAEVVADLEVMISEKKARITSGPLPTIRAIPGQMHQLFYNLLGNAMKFSQPQQPSVVTITCRQPGEEEVKNLPGLDRGICYYHITVTDNGIGFRPDQAERIFGMFQRLHSQDAFTGTGIGLALCKKVAENHGGKIWAESQEGEGARFHVLLTREGPLPK